MSHAVAVHMQQQLTFKIYVAHSEAQPLLAPSSRSALLAGCCPEAQAASMLRPVFMLTTIDCCYC